MEKKIVFSREEGRDFTTVLRERVALFFKENQMSQKANASMVLKTLFMIAVVSSIHGAILLGIGGIWGVVGLYAFLGFCIASGAMNIAHDALHGSYVTRSPGNRLLGLVMDICGASSFYWKKEHTIDHHTFTNVIYHDADLDVPFVLRVCPEAPRHFFHRLQHWYAPLLYSLNLMRWIYFSDLKRIYRVFKDRRQEAAGNPSFLEVFFLVFFKIVHIALFVALPIWVLPFAWWQVALGYVALLATTGLTMTVIFQLAHIVENVAFPLPNAKGKIENSFAKHQLETTSNFATRNKLVTFLFGGLNFQVEHHIFPHVCHIHLRKIAPIVETTAKEFGLTYHNNPSFFGAIRSHFKTLKKFGQTPRLQKAPEPPVRFSDAITSDL